jgi:hypothetical protein
MLSHIPSLFVIETGKTAMKWTLVIMILVLMDHPTLAQQQCNTDICRAVAKVVMANPRSWGDRDFHGAHAKKEVELAKVFRTTKFGTCESDRLNYILHFTCTGEFADIGEAIDVFNEAKRSLSLLVPDWSFKSEGKPLYSIGGPEHNCDANGVGKDYGVLWKEDCRAEIVVYGPYEKRLLPYGFSFHFLIPESEPSERPRAAAPTAKVATVSRTNRDKPYVEFNADAYGGATRGKTAIFYLDGQFICSVYDSCDTNTSRGRHTVTVKIEDRGDQTTGVRVDERMGFFGAENVFGSCELSKNGDLTCTNEP